jgi:hypothetical protein
MEHVGRFSWILWVADWSDVSVILRVLIMRFVAAPCRLVDAVSHTKGSSLKASVFLLLVKNLGGWKVKTKLFLCLLNTCSKAPHMLDPDKALPVDGPQRWLGRNGTPVVQLAWTKPCFFRAHRVSDNRLGVFSRQMLMDEPLVSSGLTGHRS